MKENKRKRIDRTAGGSSSIHRFMLNLRPELYEWIRSTAFHKKTSMSHEINSLLDVAKKQPEQN